MAHTNGTSNGTANGAGGSPPKIMLYTNHSCPYAHRAHIALAELKLPFEETIIDLNSPREPWYLEINPRGLVPAIKYTVPGVFDEEIVTESQIVAQFLCDSFPSHLLPATREDPTAALKRARINFFVDTWNTKVQSGMFNVLRAEGKEKDEKAAEWASTIEKEIEPLLKDAGPFFGGSSEMTFAEVIAAPFLLRFDALARDGELVPKVFGEKLDSLPGVSKWKKAVFAKKSVTGIWDEELFLQSTKKRIDKMKSGGK